MTWKWIASHLSISGDNTNHNADNSHFDNIDIDIKSSEKVEEKADATEFQSLGSGNEKSSWLHN